MGSDFNLSDSARRLAANFGALTSGGGWMDRLRGKGVYIVIAVLVLIGVSLPPISLPSRVFGGMGCTTLSEKSPSANHPDGLSIALMSTGSKTAASLSVKLSSVPQVNLLEGSAGGDLKKAVQALPANLTIKSPFYQIGVCGGRKGQAVLSAAIPNDAEPWETLDLYTWSGQAWQWVGSSVDLANEVISAQVSELPENLVVVQTSSVAPALASDVGAGSQAGQAPAGDALSVVNEVVLPGLMLGGLGEVQGERATLATPAEGASYVMIPVVRNWAESKSNVGLVLDMLADPVVRAEHVKQLVAVVANTPYAGLQVDYRDVPAELRDIYTDFISNLAAAIHKENKLLSVVLPPPAPTAEGTWDTGAYDWRAIGALADAVVLQPATDPAAFGPSGQAEQVVRWATGQIDRYKVQLAFSALSEEHAGNQVSWLPYEEAINLLGTITTTTGAQVAPGKPVTFKLSGNVQDVKYDQASKLYRFTCAGPENPRTVYLVTAAALSERLNLAVKYNLRGVLVYGLLNAANGGDARLIAALQQYKEKSIPAAPGGLEVVWTVRNQAGVQLPGGSSAITNTQYIWTAPATPGRYIVAASIPGAHTRGELPINVLAATPTPAPTLAPTPAPQTASTPGAETCMNAAYVADVTVPDGTSFDNNVGFTKSWKVKNTGTCEWGTGVVLAFQSGDKMDATETVAVGTVKPGEEVKIDVPMKSPVQAGNYKGVWRMKDSKGQLFGEVLTVLIAAGQAAPPANIPAAGSSAPPPSANVGGFELGGHVSGFTRPDLMKKAGMSWVKVQVHHGDIPSGFIATVHNNGFKILFGALGDKSKVTSGAYQAEYAQWVGELAAADADAIEVWNEMNIDREWPSGQIEPSSYVNLLRASYAAIKAKNPGTLVVSGAPAPTGYFGGCASAGCDDAPYVAGMAAAGAANYMDCLGIHYNEGIVGPDQTSGDPRTEHYTRYFWGMVNAYYNAFGGARKLCFTELGYLSPEGYGGLSSGFAWAANTTVAQQAQWLARAASLAANSGKVKLMIVWNVDFTNYGDDPMAGYAIIRPGGGCPACDTLGQVMGSR